VNLVIKLFVETFVTVRALYALDA
jgi:hypothetical protein